jgi:hypothetical protein
MILVASFRISFCAAFIVVPFVLLSLPVMPLVYRHRNTSQVGLSVFFENRLFPQETQETVLTGHLET